ncbi:MULTISPECIES: hypothetical protein [Rhodococcus]|uniref:hypothetical protein n=1 Tax=Rhodococcus TaxID=1827 RepID=UPI00071CCA83|nr:MULTISPECIES: hypothetical protein [Rhodococcus]ANQ75570.1 hypothetical protein AOT96_31585 [Rhodococcus sp. 008]KSU70556.1 hypothetical protein AS032_26770 [Rhodococcus qingshengii]SCC63845.1 hypothetical protein GA0061093_11716 [Rhodococcus qingshengii]
MFPTSDQSLAHWASHASVEEPDLGPALDDLGGFERVTSEAERVAGGPLLPYLVNAVARDFDVLQEDQANVLLDAVARGFRSPHAAWILTEALDTVCAHLVMSARLSTGLARDLTKLAEVAFTPQSQTEAAALAHPAVSGLLRLAVGGYTNPHRLLVLLTEITGAEPADALERLPILIGLAHDHFGESDLLEVLVMLENRPNLSLASRADASFELAIADVREALNAADASATEQYLRRALFRFAELDRTHEARLDARAYAAAVEAVLAFLELGQGVAGADQRISEASDRLSETTALFTAWSGRFHELTWLSARGSAQSAWSCLVTTLCTASGHLKEPSWWNPVVALNNLLDVYIASRSVHAHVAGQPDALGRLVSPTIEAAFLRTEGLRHQLEQALTTDSAFKSNSDAHKLYVAVQEHIPKSKAAEAVPGKELADRPALAALFRDGTTSLRDNLDPALLDKLDERAQEIMKGYIPTGNARFDSHLELLLGELSTSPAWTPPDSHYFTSLVAQVLRFLYDRFDAQANLYGARTAYLGPAQPTKDGKPGSWHEKALQDDLHQHLSGTLTPGTVKREISDVAGGRTDITYTPGLGAISWPKLRGGRGSAREKRWKVATCHKR